MDIGRYAKFAATLGTGCELAIYYELPEGLTMTCRVLVVEDEFFVAFEIESVLREMGLVPVGIAADSRKARELAANADLAFVDLNLADGPTGIDVGRGLADSGVTVIYMTANPAMLGTGVPGTVGVLPKPVNDSELRQAVHFAVHHHQKSPLATPPERLRLFQHPGPLGLPA
jgi:two-component system, response regulator PdtaR